MVTSDIELNGPLTVNTEVSDQRHKIKEIVDRTRTFSSRPYGPNPERSCIREFLTTTA